MKKINDTSEQFLQQIKRVFSPDIDAFTLHDGGDDFLIVEVNQTWMFRFPRNQLSRKAMEIETNFLNEFAAVSPLPVPARSFIDQDFIGYKKIQGEQLTFEVFADLSKVVRKRIAQQLGQFLSAIHNFPVDKASDLGIGRGWNGLHHKNGEYFLEHVTPRLSPTAREKSIPLMESLLAEEFEGRVIHGDFYLPDHVFYDGNMQRLSGVIDFGDVSIYDPAHDWQCILEIGGEEFFETALGHYQA